MDHEELLNEVKQSNELLRSQLLWTRIAAALLAVLLVAVIVCLGSTMNSLGRINAQMEQVDLAAVSRQIALLDVEGLSKAVSELDVAEFNNAIKNLNAAVQELQSASEAAKAWGDRVSEGLGGIFSK